MTSSTVSGPSLRADTLLPVRLKPALGEAVASYSRRLSDANGITTRQLARICGQDPAASAQARHVLAGRAGIKREEFDSLTLASARTSLRGNPSCWRLKSTVWTCHACSLEGIEQALRGFAIQFLCLRCGTFLSRPEEVHRLATAPNDELVALQMELLDAIPARDHEAVASRFTRMWHLIRTGSLTRWYQKSMNLEPSGAGSYLSRARSFAYGVPEVPRMVGAVLSKTWEQTASTNVLYLQTRALRKIHHQEFRQARIHEYFTEIDPADCMQRRSPPGLAEHAIGERVRYLVRRGLRSTHIPKEVRYRSDPFLIDDTVWRWRRHVCGQLRYWLLGIELTGEVISSRRDGRSVPDDVEDRLAELKRSVHSREAIVGEYFTAATARTVLSQILTLAEDIACEVTSYADPRVHLSRESLGQLAPSVNCFGPRGIELARAWMWLDEVAGKDAYGYLPMMPPSSMAMFDKALRPEERLSLREYRIRQQRLSADEIAPPSPQTRFALRLA